MHVRIAMTVFLAALAFAGGSAIAEEPTLHEVYQAAQSGNISEAQRMMQEVLRRPPQ